MGIKGEEYGLAVQTVCLLDHPAYDLLMPDMNAVEGSYGKDSGLLAGKIGDAVVSFHQKREKGFIFWLLKRIALVAKLRLVFSIFILCTIFPASGQESLRWSALTSSTSARGTDEIYEYVLDANSLRSLVESPVFSRQEIFTSIPMPGGALSELRFEPHSSLHPELAARYPRIRSFTGWDPKSGIRARISLSPRGIQATYRLDDGSLWVLDPVDRSKGRYVLRGASSIEIDEFQCLTETKGHSESLESSARVVTDGTLRILRLAVTTPGEYTDYHGGTKEAALAAINATVTRNNEIFMVDVGVQLQLIPNNDELIFLDADTDPFDSDNLISESANTINTIIGGLNYDLGHLFQSEDNSLLGQAGGIGTVCRDDIKGSGFSRQEQAEGFVFDFLVAHELGHQFGANHTFSFRSEFTGVQAEPGSGTTIMGYAGITGPNNVAPFADGYFHINSMVQIRNYLATQSCGETIETGNTAPVLGEVVSSFLIPQGTAFVLEASATDADGDDLTYCWEQVDNGLVTRTNFGPTNREGANFRSRPPVPDGARYFPNLNAVRVGQLTQTDPSSNTAWETVSTVARDMRFNVTVRDNEASGGQVVTESVDIEVVQQAGPFAFTNLNTGSTLEAGSPIELTWDVAGTNSDPIFVDEVTVLASSDGGRSFPFVVQEDVPNTGSATIQVPPISTEELRFMIRAEGNVFFAVNAANQIVDVPDFLVTLGQSQISVCGAEDVQIPFVYQNFTGDTPEVDFSVQSPEGITATLDPENSSNGIQEGTLDITLDPAIEAGSYDLLVEAVIGQEIKQTTFTLVVGAEIAQGPELLFPGNAEGFSDIFIDLGWAALPGVLEYVVEIARDAEFTDMVKEERVFETATSFENPDETTLYYWRVKAVNACNEGPYSEVRTFFAPTVEQRTYSSPDIPVEIPESGVSTSTVVINVEENRPVRDVNVVVIANHTYVGDLQIVLISPNGTRVTLIDQLCDENENIDAILDDSGGGFACQFLAPTIRGRIAPVEPLSTIEGELSGGQWRLEVNDFFDGDGGSISEFSLELTLIGNPPTDEDGDGVPNTEDLCLGTPEGQAVDVTGCPVFLLNADFFGIKIDSETCRQNNDGLVRLTAFETGLTYTAILTGNGRDQTLSFSNSVDFSGLSSGIYDLCVNATDGTNTYQDLCFQVSIREPDPLNVIAQLSLDGSELALSMRGSTLYSIELNGERIQTTQNVRKFSLAPGLNTVRVVGDQECLGAYEASFVYGSAVYVAPNPVENFVQLRLPGMVDEATLQVFDASGALRIQREVRLDAGALNWNAGALPAGLYFLRVSAPGFNASTKFVKR